MSSASVGSETIDSKKVMPDDTRDMRRRAQSRSKSADEYGRIATQPSAAAPSAGQHTWCCHYSFVNSEGFDFGAQR